MKTLFLLLTVLFYVAASNSLYVDPKNVCAISFPAPRLVSREGALIPESLHVLCEWESTQFCESQNATFVEEDRMHCYASDPAIIIRRAVINCTNIPSKDERVVIEEVIEQDSCFATIDVDVYEAPKIKPIVKKQNLMWIPRKDEPEPVREEIRVAENPAFKMYGRLMKTYYDALLSRQIVQYNIPKERRVTCMTPEKHEQIKRNIEGIASKYREIHKYNDKEVGEIFAPIIIAIAALCTLFGLTCGCSAFKFIKVAVRGCMLFFCFIVICAVIVAGLIGIITSATQLAVH